MNGWEKMLVALAALAAVTLLTLSGALDGAHAAHLLETMIGGVCGGSALGYVAGRVKK